MDRLMQLYVICWSFLSNFDKISSLSAYNAIFSVVQFIFKLQVKLILFIQILFIIVNLHIILNKSFLQSRIFISTHSICST